MPSLTLTPSSYSLSNTSYLTITNADNMYTDVSSNTYATIQNTRQSSTSYYLYLRGFNTSSLPADAEIQSFTVKLKGYQSGCNTGTSYRPQLCQGTSAITNTYANALGTSVDTVTFANSSLTWDSIVNYGSNFGIRICIRRNNSNTAAYAYIYGAEIDVEYIIPNYYTVTATSAVNEITVSPATQSIRQERDATVTINANSLEDYMVTDNDVDVTENCVRHQVQAETQNATFIPSSFDSTNSVYNKTAGDNKNGIYSTNYIENGLTDHNSSTRCALYSVQGSGATSYMYYNFDCSSIPQNAIINSVTCQFKGGSQGSTYYSSYVAQLTTGTTLKGSSTSVTGSNSSPSTVTINGGTSWTRAELNNIKIKFTVTRGSSNTTTDSTWSFFGASLTVNYTPVIDASYYYTYTISNLSASHIILVDLAGVFIPPEEDPQYEYESLTISSINATTNPSTGTTRVIQGSNQTITITPSDPQLTLALDNGVDITSQLQGGVPNNQYTITTQVSGASYGFTLNSGTGYYVSSNNGVAKSASVARINMNFESACLVTISYINYAEATYDYGLFGKLDTAVAIDGLTASSGGSSPSDSTSNYQLICNTSAYNTSSVQTITYEVPAGTHFIDVKYGKDDGTNSNNDTLQWKITSVEATGVSGSYTYTLNNIQQKHSLIFVFGDVSFYYITSSGSEGMKLFPDGQQVKLEGDSYKISIVPEHITDTVTIYDNNVNTTNNLEREDGYDKNNNPVVSYTYRLSNIQATHTLSIIGIATADHFFFKSGNSWIEVGKLYVKINNSWIEQDLDYISENEIENIKQG